MWQFPFRGKKVSETSDSESFRKINILTEVEIPTDDHVGAFGTVRKHHVHEGVDLYCDEGEPVYAVESGTVVAIEDFTGEATGTEEFWHDTKAVLIEGASGVVNYGEIDPAEGITVGLEIHAGGCVGKVLRVLRKDKGRPLTMLHLELYEVGARETVEWTTEDSASPPGGLKDPTELLINSNKNW